MKITMRLARRGQKMTVTGSWLNSLRENIRLNCLGKETGRWWWSDWWEERENKWKNTKGNSWQIEVQNWAWMPEESIGQEILRKQQWIQAGRQVKREEECTLVPRALWLDWHSQKLVRETEKVKKSGRMKIQNWSFHILEGSNCL